MEQSKVINQLELLGVNSEITPKSLDISIPPSLSRIRRLHCLPVDNTPEEIMFVNENPGSEIILHAHGGGYIVSWHYGQTTEYQFYKKAFVGFDQKEEVYKLTCPLDPKEVCSPKYFRNSN